MVAPPPAMRTSRSPAALRAWSSAGSMPSLTKWKLRPRSSRAHASRAQREVVPVRVGHRRVHRHQGTGGRVAAEQAPAIVGSELDAGVCRGAEPRTTTKQPAPDEVGAPIDVGTPVGRRAIVRRREIPRRAGRKRGVTSGGGGDLRQDRSGRRRRRSVGTGPETGASTAAADRWALLRAARTSHQTQSRQHDTGPSSPLHLVTPASRETTTPHLAD